MSGRVQADIDDANEVVDFCTNKIDISNEQCKKTEVFIGMQSSHNGSVVRCFSKINNGRRDKDCCLAFRPGDDSFSLLHGQGRICRIRSLPVSHLEQNIRKNKLIRHRINLRRI